MCRIPVLVRSAEPGLPAVGGAGGRNDLVKGKRGDNTAVLLSTIPSALVTVKLYDMLTVQRLLAMILAPFRTNDRASCGAEKLLADAACEAPFITPAGAERRLLSYSGAMMLAQFRFDAGITTLVF